MSDTERWTANTKFLDRTINRGDAIFLATPLNQVRPGSYFARELEYLSGKGFTPSEDGTQLLRSGIDMTGLENLAPSVAKIALEKGMQIITERYEPSSFGDALVELASDDFRLRIIRDRGQITIEISPLAKTDWRSVENVLAFLGKQCPPQDVEALSETLSQNYEKVVALMTSSLSKSGLDTFERKQSEAFIQRLFPSSNLT